MNKQDDPPIKERLKEISAIRIYDDEQIYLEMELLRKHIDYIGEDIKKVKRQITFLGALIEGIANKLGAKPYYPKNFKRYK